MASTRTKFDKKRRFASVLPTGEVLERLAVAVRSGGNPGHKRDPGDFGLTPPSLPRDDKSLCDEARIFERAEAVRLLRAGVRRGMISPWDGNGYPKHIWSMTEEGIPLEAILENAGDGACHGYPLEANDDFRAWVITRWNQAHE
ncbi:MAG: hypothetical protein WC076_05230 [Terrimicrobiaceae bacterium]|nr:hypothetical protein [Terrimicrobiaceae bacterium]